MIRNRDFLSYHSWHVQRQMSRQKRGYSLIGNKIENDEQLVENKNATRFNLPALPQMKNISIFFVSEQREIEFMRRKIGGIAELSLRERWITVHRNQFLSVPDDSNVPPSERHNLHGACMAEGDRIFPDLRRSHAEDLAVSKNNASLGTLLTFILRYAPRVRSEERCLLCKRWIRRRRNSPSLHARHACGKLHSYTF